MSVQLPSALAVTMLTAALGLASAAGDAQAVSQFRSFVQNPTGVCQSALPVFEGQIRKRPLALQNEGTAPAFLSCSLMSTDRSVAGVTLINIHATNDTAGPIDLHCTLVTGLSKFGAPQFYPKTFRVDDDNVLFSWTSAQDNGGLPFNNFTVNVSCNLPVGIGLTGLSVHFAEDIGA